MRTVTILSTKGKASIRSVSGTIPCGRSFRKAPDSHGVVTHRDHDFHGNRALRHLGEHPGEDISGIEEKHQVIARSNSVDKGGDLRRPAKVRHVVAPECGNGIERAFKIIGEEKSDLLYASLRRGTLS